MLIFALKDELKAASLPFLLLPYTFFIFFKTLTGIKKSGESSSSLRQMINRSYLLLLWKLLEIQLPFISRTQDIEKATHEVPLI